MYVGFCVFIWLYNIGQYKLKVRSSLHVSKCTLFCYFGCRFICIEASTYNIFFLFVSMHIGM